jgi:hypothetical protein
MYIYRKKDVIKPIDYIDSKDEYEIEERIIKIVKEDRSCKDINSFKTKFNGIYTAYYSEEMPYILLTSKYLLNEDGSINNKIDNVDPLTIINSHKRRRRKPKTDDN